MFIYKAPPANSPAVMVERPFSPRPAASLSKFILMNSSASDADAQRAENSSRWKLNANVVAARKWVCPIQFKIKAIKIG